MHSQPPTHPQPTPNPPTQQLQALSSFATPAQMDVEFTRAMSLLRTGDVSS